MINHKYKRVVDNKLKYFGETNEKTRTITINKKKAMKSGPGELIDTIVHEELHASYPRMKEKTVQRKTEKMVKTMTEKQKKKMYSRYVKK